MAQAKNGDTVKVHYTGTLKDGTEFDSSRDREPLEFKIGEQKVIGGFENGVVGMEAGETKTVEVPAGEAYGEVREDLILVVNRTDLPPDVEPKVGDRYQVTGEGGHPTVVTVTDMNDDTVTLDANHPLAGKDLTFEIELLEIA